MTADAALLEEMSLEVDESALTGESQAVRKKVGEDLFMHTYVTAGHGKALV